MIRRNNKYIIPTIWCMCVSAILVCGTFTKWTTAFAPCEQPKPEDGGCGGLITLVVGNETISQSVCENWPGCTYDRKVCRSRNACDEVKCGVRDISVRMAGKILPSCVRGDQIKCGEELDLVAASMRMSKDCGVTSSYGSQVSAVQNEPHFVTSTVNPLPSEPVVFVDYVNGSDEKNGSSRQLAVKTLARALELSRAMKNHTRTIVLMPGKHRLLKTVTLDQRDSNTTFQGETGAILTAAIDLSSLNWTKIDSVTYSSSIPPEILRYLGQLSVLSFRGVSMVRARWPNKNSYMDVIFAPQNGAVHWPARPKSRIFGRQFFQPVLPAGQYTRFRTFTMSENGPCQGVFTPPMGYFCSPKADADGICAYSIPGAVVVTASTISSARMSAWTNIGTGYVHALHPEKWGGWSFQIQGPTSPTGRLLQGSEPSVQDDVDGMEDLNRSLRGVSGDGNESLEASRTVPRNRLMFAQGGFQEARGDCGQGAGDFYFENIRELLDYPGEYFLNLAEGTLYFIPPATGETPLTSDDLEISSNVTRLIEVLSENAVMAVENIKFLNIRFESTYPTHMEPHEMPSGGDWTLHRGAALFVQNARNVMVADCTFTKLGSNGLFLSNYARDVDIARNSFYHLDASGILLAGDPKLTSPTPWDRRYDEDYIARVRIRNNHIHDLGAMELQAAGIFLSITKDITIERNVIYNGPRAGIILNDLYGGNHTTRLNILFSLVSTTSDHGPYNAWDRQQWLLPENVTQAVNVVDRNIIWGSYKGPKTVDLDDGARDHVVQRNLIASGFLKFKGNNILATQNVLTSLLYNEPYCLVICAGQERPVNMVYESNTCFGKAPPYGWRQEVRFWCSSKDYWVTRNNTFFGVVPSFAACGSYMDWRWKYKQDVDSIFAKKPANWVVLQYARSLVESFGL